jgi:hypothetical protein
MPRARPVKVNVSPLYEDTLLLTIQEGPIMVTGKIRYEDAEDLRNQLDVVLAAKESIDGGQKQVR